METPTPNPSSPPLTYEETPEIQPVFEKSAPESQAPVYTPPTPPKSSPVGSILKAVAGFVILFIVGYVASGYIRQYLAKTPTTVTPSQETTVLEPTPEVIASIATRPLTQTTPLVSSQLTGTPSAVADTAWKQYAVVNGITRKAVEGISYQLPPDVLAPICDGSTCASQGTYLPGGTRFTVAPRGTGQVLADYRNRIISDLSGKAFTVKETTINGKKAIEFSGTFTGSTVGGYAFTNMHGYMIEVSDTFSLEINHFSPSGITADFVKDETTFAAIVKTVSFSSVAVTQSTPTKAPTSTPKAK